MKWRSVFTIFALHVHFSWHGCLTGLLIFPVWRCTSEVVPHCRILFPFETMFIIIEYSLSVCVSLSEQQLIYIYYSNVFTYRLHRIRRILDCEGLKCNWSIHRNIRSCINESLASFSIKIVHVNFGAGRGCFSFNRSKIVIFIKL